MSKESAKAALGESKIKLCRKRPVSCQSTSYLRGISFVFLFDFFKAPSASPFFPNFLPNHFGLDTRILVPLEAGQSSYPSELF